MSRALQIVSGVVLLSALLGAGLQAGQVQSQPSADAVGAPGAQLPTFKSEVDYVEVDVVVTDGKGKPVRDLRQDDFQLFEDGKRQAIANFAFVNIPTEPADRPLSQTETIEPDTTNNERPFSGRLYVVVLDDLYIESGRLLNVRNTVRLFIERNLGANDLMAIVSTGGSSDWSQEFTSNKRLLLDVVDRFMGQKLDAGAGPATEHARMAAALKAITHVVNWFGGIRGRRKTMLLVSEGIRLSNDLKELIMGQDEVLFSGVNAARADSQAVIAAATRANVSIYTIDPRGLTTPRGDNDILVSSYRDEPRAALTRLGTELRDQQLTLRMFAEETGGLAVLNTNDFGSSFDRIVDENSTYYVLAYYPSSERDGKFHKIDVKTTRRGLNLRSRKGYQAPRGKASPAKATEAGDPSPDLLEALDSPIPISGLPMRVFAAPFKGTGANASVLLGVELVGRGLGAAQGEKIELSYVAVDTRGETRAASTDNFTTNLNPETKARAQQAGLRVLNRIALPPGRYAMRVAARDAAARTTGSVTYDLDVPDFTKPSLSVSGILLTSMSGSVMVTAKGDDQTKEVLPASPIVARNFPQNDEIALFAEIYDNQVGPAHRVDITTTIQADDGRVVFKAEDERDSSELSRGNGAYGYALRIPLSEIAPGAYVLHLQARSRLGKQESVGRRVRIVVTPAA